MVIQGGALHNLVVSVKTRLCRVRWAGRDLTQRCRAEGDDRVQPHATDSTLGTAAQAVLLLTCPARGLAAGNRSCFIPVATNPWPAFAAVRDQPPQSCHGISCACTTRPAPGRISPLALHVQSPRRPHEMPSRGRQCSTSGREEGRFLPLKVNASMTEFAPSLTCISNKTQSTPLLTPPH